MAMARALEIRPVQELSPSQFMEGSFPCQAPLPALPRTGLVASHGDVTR